jgi:hypothetical protein
MSNKQLVHVVSLSASAFHSIFIPLQTMYVALHAACAMAHSKHTRMHCNIPNTAQPIKPACQPTPWSARDYGPAHSNPQCRLSGWAGPALPALPCMRHTSHNALPLRACSLVDNPTPIHTTHTKSAKHNMLTPSNAVVPAETLKCGLASHTSTELLLSLNTQHKPTLTHISLLCRNMKFLLLCLNLKPCRASRMKVGPMPARRSAPVDQTHCTD